MPESNFHFRGSRLRTFSPGGLKFALFAASRITVLLLAFLSSFYAILSFLPFTYWAFIRAPHGWVVPAFVRYHGLLLALAIALTGLALIVHRRENAQARAGWISPCCAAALIAYLAYRYPLGSVRNDETSYYLAVAWMVAPLALVVGDFAGLNAPMQRALAHPDWRATLQAIALCIATSQLSYLVPLLTLSEGGGLHLIDVRLILESAILQFGAATLLIVVFRSASVILRRFQLAPGVELGFRLLVASGITAFAFHRIVQRSFDFEINAAYVYATLTGTVLVGNYYGLKIAYFAHREAGDPKATRWMLAALGVLVAAGIFVPAAIGAMDWNYIGHKLWSVLLWLALTLLFWSRAGSIGVQRGKLHWATQAGAVSLVALGLTAMHARSSDPEETQRADRYANLDVNYHALRDVLAAGSGIACDEFCNFLRTHTNLLPSARPGRMDLVFQPAGQAPTGVSPHMFVIVVDSLRQDYVSAYNPKVTFTPEIAKFSAESFVFKNAFARYDGTSLSEPSIWSGTMQIHKNWAQPFTAMNNLEQLATADGYQQYVVIDTILRELLDPRLPRVPLAKNATNWWSYDFCSTREEMAALLPHRNPGKPVFLYAQPTNVHQRTLQYSRRIREPQPQPPGFAGFYASELQRFDRCFGEFLATLKRLDLYKDSVIVLTSDHGEALVGSDNRHGFALRPDEVKIPLIVRVPERVAMSLTTDLERPAFLTDITPTLFVLTGRKVQNAGGVYGRPLFVPKGTPLSPLEDEYLLASSYVPNYALVSGDGTKLYIIDTVKAREFYFDLSRDPEAQTNILTPEISHAKRAIMRAKIEQIAREFHYQPNRLKNWLFH